jgi:hypothetical protein
VTSASSSDRVLYQAYAGEAVYLHPIVVSALIRGRRMEDLPNVLEVPVAEVSHFCLTPAMRSRYPLLRHLPVRYRSLCIDAED